MNIPTILVIFGGTGDLMRKKIVPAVFHLHERKKLPAMFKVVGFTKDDMRDSQFQSFIGSALKAHMEKTDFAPDAEFLKLFCCCKGDFGNLADYESLDKYLHSLDDKWGVCANKLFYAASPPQFYETIFRRLAGSGLTKPCSEEEGWTRVIVEKPFGRDLKTARSLEKLLSKLFKEIQIYRIDHYLAKEALQNILVFRFSNNLFEQSWNKDFIEKIEIRLLEKIGVEDRGNFYDGLGALRDMGQNHILQLLAAVAMDNPGDFSAEAIRSKRREVLRALMKPSESEIKSFTFRGQHKEYRDIEGVAKDSLTETYFKVKTFLSVQKWQRVPIILESGKRLNSQLKEIIVSFQPGEHYQNKIIIRFEPEEQIILQIWSKKPGFTFDVEKRYFSFPLRGKEGKYHYIEEYEKLLLDCISGDQTLFVSSQELASMWNFVDPIIKSWQKKSVPLFEYKPDTDEPIIASAWINQEIKPSFVPLSGTSEAKKEIGIVGLGKMGSNIKLRLESKGWQALGFDKNPDFEKLVNGLTAPRIVWMMIPPKAVEEVIFGKDGLIKFLSRGDVIIDGGNSFYKDSIKRFGKLKKVGIHFVDVGISGGPKGALGGSSIMVGGKKPMFKKLEVLFYDLAKDGGLQFFEGAGAGHFVKMIHNGIEYGIMQAIAEGFTILKKAKYKLDMAKIADVYNHGSVIESRLMSWLKDALILRGDNLKGVSGSVDHTGEAEWTIKTAKELRVSAKIIESALKFRIKSKNNPDYTGKILSALREQFGGHSPKNKKN